MSSFVGGILTTERIAEKKEAPATLGTYINAFAVLVPAEVLLAHAFIMSLATKTSTVNGEEVVSITHQDTVQFVFWGLLALSSLLYLAGRVSSAFAKAAADGPGAARTRWQWFLDGVRSIIPAAAFVGWTTIQKNTAIDAVVDWDQTSRAMIAVLGALALGPIAALLSYSAHREVRSIA